MSDGRRDFIHGLATCPVCTQRRDAEDRYLEQVEFTQVRMQEREDALLALASDQEELHRLIAILADVQETEESAAAVGWSPREFTLPDFIRCLDRKRTEAQQEANKDRIALVAADEAGARLSERVKELEAELAKPCTYEGPPMAHPFNTNGCIVVEILPEAE